MVSGRVPNTDSTFTFLMGSKPFQRIFQKNQILVYKELTELLRFFVEETVARIFATAFFLYLAASLDKGKHGFAAIFYFPAAFRTSPRNLMLF